MLMEYRGHTNEELEEIEARFDKTCTPEDLKNYLHEIFELTEDQARELVKKHAEVVTHMMNEEALTYVVADVIRDTELMEGKRAPGS